MSVFFKKGGAKIKNTGSPFNPKEYQTQKAIVKNELLAGKSITQKEAIENYGIYALSPRISDLRNEGMQIETKHESRKGGGFYARYRIPPDELEEARQAAYGK